MIGNRVLFAFLPLFLALILTVSTAPVLEIQLRPTTFGLTLLNETSPATTESVTYDDDDDSGDSDDEDNQSTTIEYQEDTTNIQELLSEAMTDIPLNIDEILQLNDILRANLDKLPSTPTTEHPDDSEHHA